VSEKRGWRGRKEGKKAPPFFNSFQLTDLVDGLADGILQLAVAGIVVGPWRRSRNSSNSGGGGGGGGTSAVGRAERRPLILRRRGRGGCRRMRGSSSSSSSSSSDVREQALDGEGLPRGL